MKISTINAIYFSPTSTGKDNCLKLAQSINSNLTVKEFDFTLGIPSNLPEFTSEDLCIIAAPVYGGRLPAQVLERFKSLKTKKSPAVVIANYGNRGIDDALLELRNIISIKGFLTFAAVTTIGEHSFSRKNMPIAQGRPDTKDFEEDIKFGTTIGKFLENTEKLKLIEVPGKYPYKVKGTHTPAAPITDNELCTKCMTCVENCPVGAISLKDDIIFCDPDTCIKCNACVKNCPTGALSFFTPYTKKLHENFHERQEPKLYI